jgi:uncharacterized protein (TIGR02145 family)
MKKLQIKLFIVLAACFALLNSCTKNEIKTTSLSNNSTSDEIAIGNQVWMKKNLDVDHYRNGDPIPQVTNPTAWANLTTGAWCYYNNNPVNEAIYGKLYNWYAVNDPRGLAPSGFHVPSHTEWITLTTSLGGADVAGNMMRATTGWNPSSYSDTIATNSSGFTAFPGGCRNFYAYGTFYWLGEECLFWTSSLDSSNLPWYRCLPYNSSGVSSNNNGNKSWGFSVRCVRD